MHVAEEDVRVFFVFFAAVSSTQLKRLKSRKGNIHETIESKNRRTISSDDNGVLGYSNAYIGTSSQLFV